MTVLVGKSKKGSLMYPKTRHECGQCEYKIRRAAWLAGIVLWTSHEFDQSEENLKLQHESKREGLGLLGLSVLIYVIH